MILRILDDSSCVPLTIYSDDTIVGFIAYSHKEGTSDYQIDRLIVDESHQRHGYGERALRQLIDQLSHEVDCKRIVINYMSFNETAAKLYEKLGFEETDEFQKQEELESEFGARFAILITSQARSEA